MNVCLVFPRYKYPTGDIPVGIAQLLSYLKEKTSAKITVLDTTFHKDKNDAINFFKENNFDLVGFSVMITQFNDAIKLAKKIKEFNSKTKIVFGGAQPTVMPKETLKNKFIDAVCVSEGEETFSEIINNNLNFENINGIYFKNKENKIIENNKRKPLESLDILPFINLDSFDFEKYFSHWFLLDSVSPNLRGLNVFSSRGCPYNCSFCQPTLSKLFGKKVRQKSTERIIEELKHYKKKYNINAFMFDDDTFAFNSEWANEVCDLLIKENLDLIWGCNTRVNIVDYELFSKMKKAGLRKVCIGIESGSQRVLDKIYNKGITIEQIKNAVKILKDLDLKIQGYFMIGAPSETIEEINQTINFACNLPIDEATFSITTPLPNTFLYEKQKENLTKEIYEFDYYKESVFKHKLGGKKLDFLKKKALLQFYLSPKRILKTLQCFSNIPSIVKSLAKLRRF